MTHEEKPAAFLPAGSEETQYLDRSILPAGEGNAIDSRVRRRLSAGHDERHSGTVPAAAPRHGPDDGLAARRPRGRTQPARAPLGAGNEGILARGQEGPPWRPAPPF